MSAPENKIRMFPVMGGFLDGAELCHPDDRLDKPECDFVILRNCTGYGQCTYYRYEFWPGIQRWLFNKSSKYITDLK